MSSPNRIYICVKKGMAMRRSNRTTNPHFLFRLKRELAFINKANQKFFIQSYLIVQFQTFEQFI